MVYRYSRLQCFPVINWLLMWLGIGRFVGYVCGFQKKIKKYIENMSATSSENSRAELYKMCETFHKARACGFCFIRHQNFAVGNAAQLMVYYSII